MGISVLSDIDPVFIEVAKALYGESVDPRELWDVSKNMVASDVHVPGAVKTKDDEKRQRRIAQTGLAATGVATVGGLHAIHATIGEHRLRSKGGEAAAKVGRLTSKLPVKAKTAAAIGTAGWLGLHGVELVGDGLAARAQTKAMRAAKKPPADDVSKAVLGFLRPVKNVMSDAQATRHTAALGRAARTGDNIVRAGALGGTAVVAHRLGFKSGRKRGALEGPIAKGALMPKPVNGVKAINAGGLSPGLGRHGRPIGGKTPHPKLQPVIRPPGLPKPVIANGVAKSSIGLHSPAEVEHLNGLHDQHLRDAKRHGMMDGPNPLKRSTSRFVRISPGPAGRGTVSEVVSNHWSAKGGARRPKVRLIARGIAKNLTWTGEISKVDTDKRTVFGWCSLSKVDGQDVVDLQGDFLPLDEIEKSAYRYVIESRKGGDMHKRVSKGDQPLHTADLIESFVVTPDKLEQMGLRPDALPLGWWIGMKVNDDEQWAKVKSKERLGFSIHGTGSRSEMAA